MTSSYLARLADVVDQVVVPAAARIDAEGTFPTGAVAALGEAGLLGLLSATSHGGMALDLFDAARVVRSLAARCGSTAMVVAMHYSAVSVIEAHGPDDVRREIAVGRHLSTLAFSESGSRSHFWAPLGTARVEGDQIVLDAAKSWVTSAADADSYVWTSRPVDGDGAASLWLVPADTPGLKVEEGFDGVGLRGNGSCPVHAVDVRVPATAALGADGSGLDIALGVVLPTFQVLNASCSLGFMDAAIDEVVAHLGATRFEHLDQVLADQPVARAHLARMKNRADAASALVDDTIVAIADGRPDAPLRMLQAKAVCGEAALEVLDVAMRVGGGAAFRKEAGIERRFRDARASVVMAPTLDASHDLIGRALCGLPLFG